MITVRCAFVILSSGTRLTAGLTTWRFARSVRGSPGSLRAISMRCTTVVLGYSVTLHFLVLNLGGMEAPQRPQGNASGPHAGCSQLVYPALHLGRRGLLDIIEKCQ